MESSVESASRRVGGGTGGVAVAILTSGDPVRLCHRLNDALLGTSWSLERALIAAEQVYPTHPAVPGSSSQVVECVLVRTDGRPAAPDELPAYLERLEVVGVRPVQTAGGSAY